MSSHMTCEEFIEKLPEQIVFGRVIAKGCGHLRSHYMICESCAKVWSICTKVFKIAHDAPRILNDPETGDTIQRSLIYGDKFLIHCIDLVLSSAKDVREAFKILKDAKEKHDAERPRLERQLEDIPLVSNIIVGRSLDAKVAEVSGAKVTWEMIPDTEHSEPFICWNEDEEYEICPQYSTHIEEVISLYTDLAKKNRWWFGFEETTKTWIIMDNLWKIQARGNTPSIIMCLMILKHYGAKIDCYK